MNKQDYMAGVDESLLHTYNRFPIVFSHGEGVWLYDTDGKKYLDFAGGIGVCALGYGNKDFADAVKAQLDKLIHTSNLFYNVPVMTAAQKLLEVSDMDRVFFTNSGTEAIEGALKAARKYAFLRDGHTGHEFVAMENSFHGRSMGALSVTGTEAYRAQFEPLVPGVRFAAFNDLASVKDAVTDQTCAIILENIQGEGGIHPADPDFLAGIRTLCDERDILLILDEIQCGVGRTGAMFAWQHYGVKPDILTAAKAIGGGVPVGAFLMTQRVADQSLMPGDHGTTFGGNPLAGAAVTAILTIFEKEHILHHVNETALYLEQKLGELKERHDIVTDVRGMGLIQGLELVPEVPAAQVAAKAQEEGLVVITAAGNVIRLLPPLVIEREHVDEMAEKLDAVLSQN